MESESQPVARPCRHRLRTGMVARVVALMPCLSALNVMASDPLIWRTPASDLAHFRDKRIFFCKTAIADSKKDLSSTTVVNHRESLLRDGCLARHPSPAEAASTDHTSTSSTDFACSWIN